MEATWQTGVTSDGGITSLLLKALDLCFISCANTQASFVWNVDLSRVGEGLSSCSSGMYFVSKETITGEMFFLKAEQLLLTCQWLLPSEAPLATRHKRGKLTICCSVCVSICSGYCSISQTQGLTQQRCFHRALEAGGQDPGASRPGIQGALPWVQTASCVCLSQTCVQSRLLQTSVLLIETLPL